MHTENGPSEISSLGAAALPTNHQGETLEHWNRATCNIMKAKNAAQEKD